MNKYKMMYEEQNGNIKELLKQLKEKAEELEKRKMYNTTAFVQLQTIDNIIKYLEIIAD